MMRRTLSLLIPLLMAVPTLAQPFDGPRGGRDDGQRLERLAELLELSAEQEEQWRLITDEHRAGARQQGEELRGLREAIRELAAAENPELEQLGQMTLDLHRGLEAMKVSREQLEADLSAILTSDQQEKFELLLEARGSFRGDRKGPRGRRGQRHGRF